MLLVIFSLTACGEPNPDLTEADIGVIPGDVNQKVKFAVVNSIYFEDLSTEASCTTINLSEDFQKITTAEQYFELIGENGCAATTVPEVDFNYFFLVFKPSANTGSENLKPQVQVQDRTLALYNLPAATENNRLVTQSFRGWLAIPREYINLPLKNYAGETLQF